jgi:pimeloyl-ACP methyl ester carboxylesterase
MALISALKATERSLILAGLRTTHRVGALVAPERTARSIARRFFTTSRPAAARLQFSGLRPQVGNIAVPDGAVTTYEFGAVGHAPTVLLAHGWNGWAQQMDAFVEPILARGFAVLAFDHVAHGASDGTMTSLPVMIRTTERLLAVTPHVVSGVAHSLGAAALAATLATKRHELVGAVLIAPPADPRPYLTGLARMLGAPEEMLPKVQQAAESFAGTPFERLVMRSWLARQIRTPLLVAHDVEDREVPIAHGYAYTGNSGARMIATHGLGHTRILRDRHIVDSAVNFVTRRRTAYLALAA